MAVERIKLTKSDFYYDEDKDILLLDLNIDLNITGKDFYDSVIKQILDDHKKIEKQIKLENSVCKECKTKHPYHKSECSEVVYHPCR